MFEINKINKKILDVINQYSSLSEALSNFVENPTQENINNLTEKINNIDSKEKNLKDSIFYIIKIVMNPDSEVVEGEKKDNGIEL